MQYNRGSASLGKIHQPKLETREWVNASRHAFSSRMLYTPISGRKLPPKKLLFSPLNTMSYPYQYTDNLSSSAVPFESTSQQINSPWSVTSSGNFEDIQAQMGVTAALYSQDFTTQQQLHVGTSSLQTSAPDNDAPATSPTQTQVYEPPRVIQLVERRPRRTQQNQQSAKGRIRDQHPGASMNKRNFESVNPPVPRPTQPEAQNQYSQASPSAEPQTGWFNMLNMSRAKSHGLVQRPTSTICETRNSTHPYYRPSGCGFSTIDTSKQKGKEVSNRCAVILHSAKPPNFVLNSLILTYEVQMKSNRLHQNHLHLFNQRPKGLI